MLHRVLILGAVLACMEVGTAAAIDLPPDFVSENVTPGASFDTPTGMAFLPDGRILVAEKRGRVYIIQNGVKRSTPLWSRENEVLNINDRGLLDVAVDPAFATNRYIYLLYTVDPDSNGVDQGVAFGRLTRYQVSAGDPNALDPASRTILMGATWGQGPCSGSGSHTIGSLRWGADGSLLVSAGEGAEYVDDSGGQHPDMFWPGRTDPNEDIGAFRAQYIGSLAGKILRLNPQNGRGYSSNPFYNGDLDAVQSKVYAYGLRNPFRFVVKPGTGSSNPSAGNPGVLFIGDVGSNTWEELNVATQPGQNFGWPCYEGPEEGLLYDASPAHHDCDSPGSPENPSLPRFGLASWHHWNGSASTPSGMTGNSAVAGAFYTATQYPSIYRNRCFFFDFGTNVIKLAVTDGSYNLTSVLDFATDANGPVDMAVHPVSGDLHYVSIYDGRVNRIRYGSVANNNNPIAVATGSPTSGPAPLDVSFSSAASSDPDNDPITPSWSFDDLTSSTEANPTHTFNNPGTFNVVLTVEDDRGGFARDTVVVSVTGSPTVFPSSGMIDRFNRPDGPLGGSWVGYTGGLSVQGQRLTMTSGDGWAVWTGATFGAWQEVYCTIADASPLAPEHDLMLKVQGDSWANGEIEVRYDAVFQRIVVSTYDPSGGWQQHGSPIPIALAAGDQFGARADGNGAVQVFVNGTVVGAASVAGWPFHASGGRVGITLVGPEPLSVDDFGGGDVSATVNTAPQATILAPADGAFFAHGILVSLSGQGADSQQSSETLLYHWRIDLHHNTHVHPSSYVAETENWSFVPDNHDDGTGIWYQVFLEVTDGGGLRDTAVISMYPETDLEPAALTVDPETPGTGSPASYSFLVHNYGRMTAQRFHWTLSSAGIPIAAGDTLVAELDSVRVSTTAPPVLPAGVHDVTLTLDTGNAVHETNEDNNTFTRPVDIITSVLSSEEASVRGLALSRAFPNPSAGPVSFDLALPRAAAVEFTILDLQGREVWSVRHARGPGHGMLRWEGTDARGHRAEPGLYLARVAVDGQVFTRRLALMR